MSALTREKEHGENFSIYCLNMAIIENTWLFIHLMNIYCNLKNTVISNS